ncbi:MAG: diaminopimelate epimerase [Ignavibacteriae bacterium]|nr:diaminopimelate epimerase [Ignavibacteriota bacterium]
MDYKKYSGAGNTFLMLNNLDGAIKKHRDTVLELIGIQGNDNFDGVIFVENSDIADFHMNYYNKDGTGNALCGNGLRCTARYIQDNNLSDRKTQAIEAVSKIYRSDILEDGNISISFPPPNFIKPGFNLRVQFTEWWQTLRVHFADVGSPHIVVYIKDIKQPLIQNLYEVNINDWGRNIRMHKDLMPDGANVNFVQLISYENSELEIRSYERGVEGETLACGTGAISTAIISYMVYDIKPPVKILTKSREYLTVDFSDENGEIRNLTLAGRATLMDNQ